MTKLGFMVSHLGDSQLAFHLIHSVNAYLKNHIDMDVIAFTYNFIRPWQIPLFATMNINEAYDYDGIAIATNLDSAEKILNFPGPRKRFFYVWDLEWMRGGDRSYDQYLSVYRNPRIELISRAKDHAIAIEKCWNRRPLATIEDCNIEHFMEIANAKSS